MVNPVRAELEVRLCDRTFKARVAFQQLAEIEQRTGLSMYKLARAINYGDASLQQLFDVLRVAIDGHGKDQVNDETLGSLILRHGVPETGLQAFEVLRVGLDTGQQGADEGNVEATPGTN